MALDPKIVSELRTALLSLGMSEADIEALNLSELPEDAARGVVAGLAVPQRVKPQVGFAMLLDGVATEGPRSLTHVFRLAAIAAEHGGSHILAGIVISLATAAAAALPPDDERTPQDFLRLIADRFDEPSAVSFDEVKAEWHEVRGMQDIEDDLRRVESGDFDIGDILPEQ